MTTQPKKLIDRISQGDWSTSRDAVPEGHIQITVYTESDGLRVATVFRDEANAEAIALLPKLLRENEQLKLQNEKFESLLYQISRSVCLDQKLSGKCLCFSCEAKAALGEK